MTNLSSNDNAKYSGLGSRYSTSSAIMASVEVKLPFFSLSDVKDQKFEKVLMA